MSGPKSELKQIDANIKAIREELDLDGWSERLEEERRSYESGNNMALLEAISICAYCYLPLPDWASRAYISAYNEVRRGRSNSWDEVFRKPYPGKHIDKIRQRHDLRFAVWFCVEHLRQNSDIPLNSSRCRDGALETVAEELGIGRTLCNELYYETKKLMQDFDRRFGPRGK